MTWKCLDVVGLQIYSWQYLSYFQVAFWWHSMLKIVGFVNLLPTISKVKRKVFCCPFITHQDYQYVWDSIFCWPNCNMYDNWTTFCAAITMWQLHTLTKIGFRQNYSERQARIRWGTFGQNTCQILEPFGREWRVYRKSCNLLSYFWYSIKNFQQLNQGFAENLVLTHLFSNTKVWIFDYDSEETQEDRAECSPLCLHLFDYTLLPLSATSCDYCYDAFSTVLNLKKRKKMV